jgi:hypothetical protein
LSSRSANSNRRSIVSRPSTRVGRGSVMNRDVMRFTLLDASKSVPRDSRLSIIQWQNEPHERGNSGHRPSME